MLDTALTLAAEGKGARTDRKESVIRRRYQRGCLFIRGNVWVARWREDVIAPDGTPRRDLRWQVLGPLHEIPNKREARKILDSLLRPINQGRQLPQSTMLFEQFVREKWNPAVLPTLRAGSARYYSIQLRCHLLPEFRARRLCDITRVEVQCFLAEKRKQGLSGSTVHGIRTALSKVLQAAVEWNFLEQNPARGIRIGDRTPKTERLYLNPQEVLRLLSSLPEPCRTVVLVAVLTGMRIGEILALRWKNLDLLRGSIQIRETVSEGIFGAPKTRSSRRDVPMSEPVRKAFEVQRGQSRQTGSGDLVFATRKQTPLNPKNLLRRILRPTCDALELPAITWHSFRHTHATLLGETGESLRTAQAILGHSDLETTLNVYTHAIPESQRRAVAKVAVILFADVRKIAAPTENQKVN
jgi:integrase